MFKAMDSTCCGLTVKSLVLNGLEFNLKTTERFKTATLKCHVVSDYIFILKKKTILSTENIKNI